MLASAISKVGSRRPHDVGLGESQRVKLSKELSRRATFNTLTLDEPTNGLHFRSSQIASKCFIIGRAGNTVVFIEPNDSSHRERTTWMIGPL